jgi:hypothetical protein
MRGVVAIGEARRSRQPQPDISSSGGLNKYLNASGPGPEDIEKRKRMPGQEGQTSAGVVAAARCDDKDGVGAKGRAPSQVGRSPYMAYVSTSIPARGRTALLARPALHTGTPVCQGADRARTD